MLELPESYTVAKQMRTTIIGKTINKVVVNASPHKFAFFFGDPAEYSNRLTGKTITNAESFAGFVRMSCNDLRILLNDGVNIRYHPENDPIPEKHQLLIGFDDASSIVCTVQMYGGLWVFQEKENENLYYQVALEKPSPLSVSFDLAYFLNLFSITKSTLSAKAFLATGQRIPGLGNGCLQDILFNAKINPRTKICTFSAEVKERLFASVKDTLKKMTELGGRNTEKDLFGRPGGYSTILSSLTWQNPCPACGEHIIKQAYLGGSVYFCPHCQPVL